MNVGVLPDLYGLSHFRPQWHILTFLQGFLDGGLGQSLVEVDLATISVYHVGVDGKAVG